MKRILPATIWAFALAAFTFVGCSTQTTIDQPAAGEAATEEVSADDASTDDGSTGEEVATPDTGDSTVSEEIAADNAAVDEAVAAADEVAASADASAAAVSTELTAAEQAAATAQKICPVSDEELGSMGSPIKVSIKGRDIYLCCEACVDAVKEDPDKYIAILDAAKKAEGAATGGEASDAATDAPAESAPAADGATS